MRLNWIDWSQSPLQFLAHDEFSSSSRRSCPVVILPLHSHITHSQHNPSHNQGAKAAETLGKAGQINWAATCVGYWSPGPGHMQELVTRPDTATEDIIFPPRPAAASAAGWSLFPTFSAGNSLNLHHCDWQESSRAVLLRTDQLSSLYVAPQNCILASVQHYFIHYTIQIR